MKKQEEEKPSPAPDYYQVTDLAASAVRTRTQSLAEPRPFECDICGSCWGRNSALIIHMRVHTGEKPYRCSYCPRSFRQKGVLTRHEKMHRNERSHCCPHCPKAYVKASNLLEHARRNHLRLKLFECPECSEKFYDDTGVKHHRIRNHGGEFPYTCTYCDTKYLHRSNLNYHLKSIHGILLPYSCSKCNQKFRIKNELLCHEGTHEDEDDLEAVKVSTTKQFVKPPVSQPTLIPAKSQKNEHKIKSPVPGAKVQNNQKKEKSQNKLIKQNKSSNAAAVEKREIESEEEISVLYEGRKQEVNLVEKENVDKSSKRKKLETVDSKKKVESMTASSPTNKIQSLEIEPAAQVENENSSTKKKYHCSCGNSYKSIEKFQRHKERNEGHEDPKVITQPSSLAEDEESPKKKIKLEKVKNEESENLKVSSSASANYQVPHLNTIAIQKRNKSVAVADKNKIKSPKSVAAATEVDRRKQEVKTNGKLIKKKKSSESSVQIEEMRNEEEDATISYRVQKENVNSDETLAKKRKRVQIKSEPENLSRVEESSPENKRKILQLSADDENDAVMVEKSFKKKYHCSCGKSYKSVEKFQSHQKKRGHDNDKKVQQSRPSSSQNAASSYFQTLSTINQEEKEEYYKADTKRLLVENESGEKSKKKKVRVLPSSNSVVVVKCERKEIKRETNASSVDDIKVQVADLKMKTKGTSFDEEGSKKEISRKIKPEKDDYQVQKRKKKTEKVNEDETFIPNIELKGEKTLKVKKKKEMKTELLQMTSQLSTFNRDETKKKRRDIKVEIQEDEIEIVEIKLTKKQDDKNEEEKCSCGKLFSSPEKFQRHRDRKGHHIPKTYKCFCSSQVFNNLEEFRSHMWENHRS